MTPAAEVSAKKKKKSSDKTKTAVSEEAAGFTADTWKPTYSGWSRKKIEKASDRGTDKNLFSGYIYDLPLAQDKEFLAVCGAIRNTTGQGWYGYVEDKQDALCTYLQKTIKGLVIWFLFCHRP